jgi:hypothetical protein
MTSMACKMIKLRTCGNHAAWIERINRGIDNSRPQVKAVARHCGKIAIKHWQDVSRLVIDNAAVLLVPKHRYGSATALFGICQRIEIARTVSCVEAALDLDAAAPDRLTQARIDRAYRDCRLQSFQPQGNQCSACPSLDIGNIAASRHHPANGFSGLRCATVTEIDAAPSAIRQRCARHFRDLYLAPPVALEGTLPD